MERLVIEAAPAPPLEISGAAALEHFDRPYQEWTAEDYQYRRAVKAHDHGAEEGSHERLVRQLLDTVIEARIGQWAHEHVRHAIRQKLEGGRNQSRLGRLSLRFDRWVSPDLYE